MRKAWLIAAAACLGSAAVAQTGSTAVAALDLPDVSAQPDAQTIHDGYKYFFFHRRDTSTAQASADLVFCTSLTKPGIALGLPGFVAWEEPTRRPTPPQTFDARYGLVGALIADRLESAISRGMYLTKMRRCMEPLGYARYPLSRAAWEAVHGGDETRSIAQQAQLATGPTPSYAEAVQ